MTIEKWFCPRCEMDVSGYPATSRRDNSTEICSQCGVAEAMADYFNKEDNTDWLNPNNKDAI